MSILFLTSALSALGLSQPGPRAVPPPSCSLEGTFLLRDRDGAEAAPSFGVVYVKTPVRGGVTTPEHFEMAQVGRQFEPRVLVVKRNDTVAFPNKDMFPHEVHSKAEVNPFEVKKNSRENMGEGVVFDVVGISHIGCAVHAEMKATILTVPSSFHVRVASDGKWKISGLEKKPVVLRFWSPGQEEVTRVLTPCVSKPQAITMPLIQVTGEGYQ